MLISKKRCDDILKRLHPDRLRELNKNPKITKTMLVFEMDEIHQIISGGTYFDYKNQKWVESE